MALFRTLCTEVSKHLVHLAESCIRALDRCVNLLFQLLPGSTVKQVRARLDELLNLCDGLTGLCCLLVQFLDFIWRIMEVLEPICPFFRLVGVLGQELPSSICRKSCRHVGHK